jgi:hypothetical protein
MGLLSYMRTLVGREKQPRDAADQLRAVMAASFTRKRLLSRAELDLFRTVEAHLPHCGPGLRLMAQPSMGEFIESPVASAYHAINAKRVDLLVIDTFGQPVLAIEHQGSGHYQSDAAARDAIKREVLRKAGVELLEVFDHHTRDDILSQVSRAIERSRPIVPAARR